MGKLIQLHKLRLQKVGRRSSAIERVSDLDDPSSRVLDTSSHLIHLRAKDHDLDGHVFNSCPSLKLQEVGRQRPIWFERTKFSCERHLSQTRSCQKGTTNTLRTGGSGTVSLTASSPVSQGWVPSANVSGTTVGVGQFPSASTCGNAEGKTHAFDARSWLTKLSNRPKPSQSSESSQGLPEPAHSTRSHSSWRLTSRQCTIDPKPIANAVDSVRPSTRRGPTSISCLPSEPRYAVSPSRTERVPSFICNFAPRPQTYGSLSLFGQRERASNEHFRACGGVDRFEFTAVGADAEGICSVQGSCQRATRFQLQQVSTRSLA